MNSWTRRDFTKTLILAGATTALGATRAAGAIPWRVALPPEVANQSHLQEGLMETAGYDPLMPLGANNRVVLHGREPCRRAARLAEVVRVTIHAAEPRARADHTSHARGRKGGPVTRRGQGYQGGPPDARAT